MENGNQLTELINKLKERGVLSNKHAKALRWLVRVLDEPVIRVIKRFVIKAIVYIIFDSIRDR